MNNDMPEPVQVTKSYYDSDDAHNFYYTIWGGEDLHLGIYESENDTIFEASRRTIRHMADRFKRVGKEARVIDLGGGFSGSARFLAKNYGWNVVVLNLSETENQRGRKMNKEQGLDHLIEVVDGNFAHIPYPDESFDLVWSQDAILHSDNRKKVLEEAHRVLKPGGEMIFTDPMQADDCPEGVLQPIYDRIHLQSLGSPGFYREYAKKLGFEEVSYEPLDPHLTTHYARVLQELERRESELEGVVSREYIENMKKGLRNWVDGGQKGYLAWGIFHFRKK
ncbi:MAG: methyltransferase domain-containing protein [Desulfobacterales bacterium]|nr:methyltransferase domain-containing protein [Desulfobacterales bacterium]MBS3809907.1 methyltransferase domain-containing protein [Desulfobacterales bacterium]